MGAVKIASTVLIVAAVLVLGAAVGVGAKQLGSEAKQAASGQAPAPARSAPVAAEKAAKAAGCRQDALSERDSDNLKAALAPTMAVPACCRTKRFGRSRQRATS
jgi:hypothetical protein